MSITKRAIKPKLCKLKTCRSSFIPYSTTQIACSPRCALEIVKQKQKAKADREHKDRKKKFYDNDKPYQTRRAIRACNSHCLLRDSNDGCISCGNRTRKMEAGHFKSAGGHPAIRFHWANVNKQCHKCNHHLSGNVAEYRKGLIKKVGVEMVEFLERDHPPQNRTAEDLRGIADWFNDQKRLLNRDASA